MKAAANRAQNSLDSKWYSNRLNLDDSGNSLSILWCCSDVKIEEFSKEYFSVVSLRVYLALI